MPKSACRDEFTVVLLELNGNPGQTFQLKQNLQQLQPQALREHICEHTTLPDSWNRKYLRESELVLSIGDAAISDEMILHQNGQCCVPGGFDPLSLSARVCSGVTDGTVIIAIVAVSDADAAPGRWQQRKEHDKLQAKVQADQQAEQFFSLAREGGGRMDGQKYTTQQCCIKTLELNDQHFHAWFGLGEHGGSSVGGQQYTKQQCFVKALEIDGQHADAWLLLGCSGHWRSRYREQIVVMIIFISIKNMVNRVTVNLSQTDHKILPNQESLSMYLDPQN